VSDCIASDDESAQFEGQVFLSSPWNRLKTAARTAGVNPPCTLATYCATARDFVIGGYTPAGRNFDAIMIGDNEGRALKRFRVARRRTNR
jgi:hypothetical protein